MTASAAPMPIFNRCDCVEGTDPASGLAAEEPGVERLFSLSSTGSGAVPPSDFKVGITMALHTASGSPKAMCVEPIEST